MLGPTAARFLPTGTVTFLVADLGRTGAHDGGPADMVATVVAPHGGGWAGAVRPAESAVIAFGSAGQAAAAAVRRGDPEGARRWLARDAAAADRGRET